MVLDTSEVDVSNATGTVGNQDAALPSEEPTALDSTTEIPPAGESESETPTPGDEPEEAGDEGNEPTEPGQPSRAERQFKARLDALLKDPAKAKDVLGSAVQPWIDEALAAREQKAQTEADQKAAEAKSQQAVQARLEKFHGVLGVPDQDGKPGTLTALQQEIEQGNQKVRAELLNPTYGTDLDALIADVGTKEARLSRLKENNTLAVDLQEYIWDQIYQGTGRVAEIPEMGASPDAVRRYFAQRDPHTAQQILAETVRKATEAAKDAQIVALEARHKTAMTAATDEVKAWRVKAGGGEAVTERGGLAAGGNGVYTRERLRQMMQTTEGMTEYRRNKTEIERQERAGLIR